MLVQSLSLFNYRNYKNLQANFHPSLNIITGKNAQGKTNILEAIFYAATGKSHRTNFDSELVSWGQEAFKITLKGTRYAGKLNIEISARSDGKKILKVNNQLKRKLTELIGNINVVLFSPEDMMLVKGGPSVRRRFLDIEISQTSPFYCHNLVQYNKAVSQRNSLLKAIREQKADEDMLEVWDRQIVSYGLPIINKRAEVIDKIVPIAREIHFGITEGQEELNLSYLPVVDFKKAGKKVSPEEYFMAKLKENRKMEILKGVTVSGPHRDDLGLKIGKTDIRAFGSQGQQRTSALSLKLSEIEYMKNETGEYPVLLLDDVMSELDSGRRKYLLEVVKGKVQTFVTSTSMKDIFDKFIDNSRLFEARTGKLIIVQED